MLKMKEFMYAALPWLFMGLALAVIVVSFVDARKRNSEKAFGQKVVISAGIGLIVSVVLYVCGFLENHIVYFILEPLLGMAIVPPILEDQEE